MPANSFSPSRSIAMPGSLYVVSLPIGNVEDITLRALRILQRVAVVAAENPEHVQALFGGHQITTPLTSYHRAVQEEKAAVLIDLLHEGQDVALVSDAGTPSICDPGIYLVSSARAAGIPVVPVPGPSALLAAFVVSGFKGDAFTFVGSLPRTPGARLRLLRSLRLEYRPLIFFVPADSRVAVLHELHRTFGNRPILVACDMTKPGERFFHGPIAMAIKSMAGRPVIGELTLIMEGKSGRVPRTPPSKRTLKPPLSSESSRGRTPRRAPD